MTDLKKRVTAALMSKPTEIELNMLLRDLASSKETDALIRIWDIRGTYKIEPETMTAIEILHDMGKGRIPQGTIIIPSDRTRLAPARRLHKICKGKILHERSQAALEHIDDAMKYVSNNPRYLSFDRGMQIKELKKNLNVSNDIARGLVTKIKQKSKKK